MNNILKKVRNNAKVDKHICLIGCGTFGQAIIDELKDSAKDIVAIDVSERAINHVKNDVDVAIIGDAADSDFIDECRLNSIDLFIVAVGNNTRDSVLIVDNLSKLIETSKNPEDKLIISKGIDEQHAKILKRLGSRHVVIPDLDQGKKLAFKLKNPIWLKNSDLDIEEFQDEYSILRFRIKDKGKKLIDKSILEIDAMNKKEILVIGITREEKGKTRYIMPGGKTIVYDNDILTVVGKMEALEDLLED